MSAVPTLDQIAADPRTVANLSEAAVKVRLAQCSIVQGALTARLLNAQPSETVLATKDPLVGAPEMARRLGVPESWIRTEQRAGRIPCVMLGRYVRFRPSEVERALAERNAR